MASAYLQGIQGAFDNQAQIRNDIHVVAINWFVNRCPLVTRVPRLPVASTTFGMVNRAFRSRKATLASAVAVADTQLTLQDASAFMNGDVLELASGERVEITADPNLTTNVVQVRRAAEGTTAATGAVGDTVLLIGNSRTGGEVNQSGVAIRPTSVLQYCQTYQHPVQVAGSLQATTGYQTQPGMSTPLDQSRMEALSEPDGRHGILVVLRAGRGPFGDVASEAEGVKDPFDFESGDGARECGGVQTVGPDPRHVGEMPHKRG